MSKETPKDDPRQESDWGSLKQTDMPWAEKPEKEQRSEAARDLARRSAVELHIGHDGRGDRR
ncbi:MAG: hypothetical protein WA418_16055 [Bradyrhizobium sp.]